MLNAIPLESLRAAIVHVNRQRDRDGALREHEPIAIVLIDLQVIGDDLELVASHLEYFVVVNAHKERGAEDTESLRERFRCLLVPGNGGAVKSNYRKA